MIARDLQERGIYNENENDHRWTWPLSACCHGAAAARKKGFAKSACHHCGSNRDRSQENIHSGQHQTSPPRSGNVFDDAEAEGQLQHWSRYWR